MIIRYFAWLRDHTKCASEDMICPDHVKDVAALISHIKTLSDGHAAAFQDMKTIRVAVNHEFATLQTDLLPDDEVAFFPPVTGG